MSDLFAQEPSAPLAEALRPKTLDEVIGQSHLLGEGKPLRLAFQSGKPHSMIFWGRLVSENNTCTSHGHCIQVRVHRLVGGLVWC